MKASYLILISFLFISSLSAQDTDSMILEEVHSIKNTLRNLEYQIKKDQNKAFRNLNELKELNDSSIQQLKDYNRSFTETGTRLQKTTKEQSKEIQNQLTKLEHNAKTRSLVHYVFHAAAIILILFLIMFLRRERKNKIEYLLKKSDKLAVQNDDILEKANELNFIKKKLRKILKQQKKIKKKK